MSSTFVIAEAACTWHIGKSSKNHLAKMLKCVHVAKACGADAVKFQWTSAPAEMAKRRNIANVATYHRLAWPAKWLPIVAAECEAVGIEFMCTVFLVKDISTISPFVKRFKIASLEALNMNIYDYCVLEKKQILISTGAMDRDELRARWLGINYDEADVAFLHCVAAYPATLDSLNLRVMRDPALGYSDHSGDVLAGAIAVAAGALYIEVHMRLDETRKDNPDYGHSHPPASLKTYIANIRKAERMLGDGIKKIEDCERALVKHRVIA